MEATIYKALAYAILAVIVIAGAIHITAETERVVGNATSQFENTIGAMDDILAEAP